MSDITYIGETNFRNKHLRFGIKDKDRLAHIYCIGKTGVGKSTLLKSMALQDILNGKGVGIIDPHGDIAEYLISKIPDSRKKDLVYIDPNDPTPLAFNPIHAIHPQYHHLVASGLVSAFKKIWADSWGPRLEYILRYSLLTLLWYPHGTLLDIHPLLTNKEFRNHILSYVKDKGIYAFWKDEFEKYPPTLRNDAILPILNKAGIFNSSQPLRAVVGQKVTGFRMQRVIDDGKIFIANLSKGKIGEESSSLLGSILVSSMQMASLYRAHYKEQDRTPFYLYIDEMQSFVTLSIADVLAECRKYGLSLFLAHQYIDQLDERIRSAIFGNVGTMICFRVGASDAEYLAKEFHPIFKEEDFVSLPRFEMYLKLMIDGVVSGGFSGVLRGNQNIDTSNLA